MWRSNDDSGGHLSGDAAETLAQQWLMQRGLRSIARNYRCKVGEIDLIVQDNNTVVFVEVRFRRQHRFGSGLESVNWRKQQKIIQAARYFLLCHKPYAEAPCRFDVMAGQTDSGGALTWHWIKDAFGT